MRVAILGPVSRRIPPRACGARERVAGLLASRLVERGVDVTLFATADSVTSARLHAVCPRPCSEDNRLDDAVWERLHVSEVFERADKFDLIHNHMGHAPLACSALVNTPMLTTIGEPLSSRVLPMYEKYNGKTSYVAVSASSMAPRLDYIGAVHHGIDPAEFPFTAKPEGYLLFFGRINGGTGAAEAMEVARRAGRKLIIAGPVLDEAYFREKIEPGLGAAADYIGVIERDMAPRILGGAEALLNMADFDYPFSLPMVEAMCCGAPVIALNRGAAAEIVDDGATGFIVDDVEAAAAAVESVGAMDRRACRLRVEEMFTADRMADDYLEVYGRILGGRDNHRPWGHYENLAEGPGHKIKRITVFPGKRLSYQRHERRAEQWTVVSGEAIVTLDGDEIPLKPGGTIHIPRGAAHRVYNPGAVPLVFSETQTGDYFGEDDIIRIEDDFGRAG